MREKKQIIKTDHSTLASEYQMSVLEKSIASMVKSQFKDDDPVGGRYFVSVQELKNKLKELGQEISLKDIEEATGKLITRLYSIFDDGGYNTRIRLFSPVLYTDESDLIKIEILSEIRRFMLECDFTTFSGWSVLRIKGIYAKHVYEMLSQHKDVGVFKISVEELRERLKMERGKLSGWTAFEKTVLELPVKEINEKTELSFTYVLHKTGRKYTDVEFHIVKKRATGEKGLAGKEEKQGELDLGV